ncbi:MAG: baseplate J/gp47 family protein [Candidatus Omnitrophica bacterium]|nr:baseplate J/gp47 family protein [Candidatus Omnitrophota bacterium]
MFKLKSFENIVASMINWCAAQTSKVTDYNIGSKWRTLIEATAMELDEFYYRMYDGLKSAIEEAIFAAFDFPLLDAAASTGIVTFSKSEAAEVDYAIPAGTIVSVPATSASSAIYFETVANVILASGATSVAAAVRCARAGTVGNVAIASIDTIVSTLVGLEAVTNASAFTDGADRETADGRKKRFNQYIATLSRGTKDALEYASKTVPNVVGAYAFENPDLSCLVYDASPEGYADQSSNINIPSGYTFSALPATEAENDALYLGCVIKFSYMYMKFYTAGVGSAGAWEYWNGSAWAEIAGVTDGTSGLTANGIVEFTVPADWVIKQVNGVSARYWIRFRVTTATYTTTPVLLYAIVPPEPGFVDVYAHNSSGVLPAEVSLSPTKDSGSGNSTMSAITVSDDATLEEDWIVAFTDATNFTVTGSKTGLDGSGETGVAFSSNSGAVSFTITAGDTPEDDTTVWIFSTASMRGKILDAIEEYRAAGIHVDVRQPEQVLVDITATLHVAAGYNKVAVRDAVSLTITNYLNALSINQPVYITRLTQIIMAMDGVYNCLIAVPAADVTVFPYQLVRAGTITITTA